MFSALIIDADEAARSTIENVLAPFGVEFSASQDAPEAMNMARAATPDIIFLRVELPSASGFSVCNKLRRNAETKGIPLVMYASDVSDDVFQQHRNLKTHADEYLKLPVDEAGLVSAVRTLIPLPEAAAAGDGELEVDIEDAIDDDDDDDVVGDFTSEFDEMAVAEDVDEDPSTPLALDDDVLEEDGGVEADPEIAEETDAAFDALTFGDDDEDDAGSTYEPEPEPEPEPAPEPEPEPEPEPAAPGGSAASRREVLNLKSQLVKKDRELLTLRDELESKERAVLDAKHKNRELQVQMGELETKLLNLEEQVISSQEAAEAAERNKDTILKREDGLKTRLEVAQKKVKDLESELIAAESAAGEAEEKSRAALEEVSQKLEAAAARASEAESERDDLANSLSEANGQVASQAEKLESLSTRITELEEKLAALAREHAAEIEFQEQESEGLANRLRDELGGLKESLESANADKDRLAGEASELTEARDKLSAELDEVRSAAAQQSQQLSERLEALENDLSANRERLDGVERELEGKRQAVARAQQALAVALKVLEPSDG